jgi:hypothetical protein
MILRIPRSPPPLQPVKRRRFIKQDDFIGTSGVAPSLQYTAEQGMKNEKAEVVLILCSALVFVSTVRARTPGRTTELSGDYALTLTGFRLQQRH